MMTNRLGVKLTGAFALVIAVGVVVTVLLARQGTVTRFAHFMVDNHMVRPERLQTVLADYYAYEKNWSTLQHDLPGLIEIASDGVMQGMMGNMLGMVDNRVEIFDSNRRVVATTELKTDALTLSNEQQDQLSLQRWPVLVGGEIAGEIVVEGTLMTGMASRNESVVEGVTRAVLVAGLVAGLVALIAAGLFVRQITRPLTTLAEASAKIARGNLNARAAITSQDEIGALALSFNHMADSLQTQEKLRRALMADVAHELRTPLAAIQGTVEAVQDGIFVADAVNLQAIHDQVMALNHLVEDLRTLANAEAGELNLDSASINLVELCQRRVTSFQAQAAQKNIVLSCHFAEAEVIIAADAQRLGQVLNNLLDNALRHTPNQGTIQLEIVRRNVEVYLTITDNGEGITLEDIPHIFDRFYRSDSSRTRKTGGTGLGLAIARQLVQAHGGQIWAQSPPTGQSAGTAFHIQLPAV